MKSTFFVGVLAFVVCACGGPDGSLFSSATGSASGSASSGGSGSGGRGGSAPDGGPSAEGGGASASAGPQSSSAGPAQFYWKPGVQQNVPIADLTGWTLCWKAQYADTTWTEAAVLAACKGSKLMLACRPNDEPTLTLAAMGDRADVTFPFPANDNTGTKNGNGVEWYFSPNSWGFAPGGDSVWKGPYDPTGISPNSPGPDGDKRLSWSASLGTIEVGYRCGFDCFQNHPGFDYKYERVMFSAP